MSEPVVIGPYAEPPVSSTYLIREPLGMGKSVWMRTRQKLAPGGWHFIDYNQLTGEIRQSFHIPGADGYMHDLYVLPESK